MPNEFYKTRITYNGTFGGWTLRMKDGTSYDFPAGDAATTFQQLGVLGIQDRYGNRLTISRDPANGNVKRVTSPNGRWIAFTYDESNHITQIVDNGGSRYSYAYDESGRLVQVTDSANGVTQYTYDANNQLLTVTDPRNTTFLTNEYDDQGRVFRQTMVDGGVYGFAYTEDVNGNIIQTDVTDARNVIRRVTFNTTGYFSGGKPTSEILAVGKPEQQTNAFEYAQDGTNFLVADVDSLNRRTTFAHDPRGNMTSITRLAGTPAAVTSYMTYDPTYNRLATRVDPLNHTTSYSYDSNGNLTSIVPPSVTPALAFPTITYESTGQISTIVTPGLGPMTFRYKNGLLDSITDATGGTWGRDVDSIGLPVRITDAIGRSTYFTYDSGHRTVGVVDGTSATIGITYDGNSNMTSVTDARSNTTTFSYDGLNRANGHTDALLKSDSLVYDKNGNITQVTDRKNQTTTITYDGLGRPAVITHADQSTETFTFDAGNRLTQLVDSLRGSMSRTYDAFDRVLTETTPSGTVTYTYDLAGRRSTMSIPGQPVVSYTYDAADRLTQITQGLNVVSFTFDSLGRRATMTLPNAVVCSYGYDSGSRLTSITYNQGQTSFGNLTYSYDAIGRRTATGGSLARVTMPAPIASATYNANNQLVQWNGATLTYDSNGNLTSDSINTYTWDVRDQLVAISGGVSASFQFDATGRRNSKTVNGATTSFLYDGGNILQEFLPTGSVTYLTGLQVDERFARTDANGTTSFLTDALSSTLALLDNAGTSIAQFTYEPFGKVSYTGALTPSQQFTGRENDGTGLYYYRSRYYSPAFQRFISEDPLGFAATDVNLYAYVKNSPTNATDPSGRLVQWVPVAEAAAEGAASAFASAGFIGAAFGAAGIVIGVGVALGTVFLIVEIIEHFPAQPMPKSSVPPPPPVPPLPPPPPFCAENGDPNEPQEGHHLLPQELEPFFQARELNIEDFVYRMPRSAHRLRPFGLHTGQGRGGDWSRQWRQFRDAYPNASREQILDQLRRMIHDFGLCY